MRKVVILFLLTSFVILQPVQGTTIVVDPPQLIDPSLTPGQFFSITINVSDVTDLNGYEFILYFNNSILNATSMKSLYPIWGDCLRYAINNSKGTIEVACVLDSPLNGDVEVEIINFSVVGTGESNLNLENTFLSDSLGGAIPHDVINGFFSNNPLGSCVRANPIVILSPELQNGTAGSTFWVNVLVKNNDNAYCNPSTFVLTYECPQDLTCSLNKNSVLLYPQHNDSSIVLTIKSDEQTHPGNYTILLTATNGSYSGSGMTNVTIFPIPGSETTITADAEPKIVDLYETTILWCDYRNATDHSVIEGANVTIENINQGINYTLTFNPETNRYEFEFNVTYTANVLMTFRCMASAPGYESNFATFQLLICRRVDPVVSVEPVTQTGTPGSTLNYTIKVRNYDHYDACGFTTFNF
jgi:hypothetical protein